VGREGCFLSKEKEQWSGEEPWRSGAELCFVSTQGGEGISRALRGRPRHPLGRGRSGLSRLGKDMAGSAATGKNGERASVLETGGD